VPGRLEGIIPALEPSHALAVVSRGNEILDVLIGNKHVSRGIAERAARNADIPPETAKKMLPLVAVALAGALQQLARPALAQLAASLPLPEETRAEPAGDSGADQQARSRPGAAGPSSHPDYGNPLPVPGGVPSTPARRRRNEPFPPPDQDGESDDSRGAEDQEDDNPLNRLPDILRRGPSQSPQGGGSLEDAIRDIVGRIFGTSNRGIVGTMIQLFLIRFLAGIVRRILASVTGR
jgi:hypothetical protein